MDYGDSYKVLLWPRVAHGPGTRLLIYWFTPGVFVFSPSAGKSTVCLECKEVSAACLYPRLLRNLLR